VINRAENHRMPVLQERGTPVRPGGEQDPGRAHRVSHHVLGMPQEVSHLQARRGAGQHRGTHAASQGESQGVMPLPFFSTPINIESSLRNPKSKD